MVAIIASFGLFQLTYFPALLVLGPTVALAHLGRGCGWGTIIAVQGLGAVVGGLLALRIRVSRPLLIGELVVVPSGLLLLALAAPLPLLAIAAIGFFVGVGFALGENLYVTAFQRNIPEHALSRISSYDWFGSVALDPIGYAIIGPIAAAIGTPGDARHRRSPERAGLPERRPGAFGAGDPIGRAGRREHHSSGGLMVAGRRILSIDGGGIRGLIPAVLLESLEAATGAPARDAFDMVAGTSTGAVLAGGVAAGFSGEQLASLYRRRGPELFRQIPVLGVLRRILTGQLYDVARLRAMIAQELGDRAGWRVNDVPIDIMVTAKGLDDGRPWYFVKDRPAENACRTGGYPLVDCLTASAAAPTYFAPWPVADIGLLVDGGTGVAGNPVYQACVEAFEYTNDYRPDDTIVVSLGTAASSIAAARPGCGRGSSGS